MSKSRSLIGKIAALVVIFAGAAFILGTVPRGAETASANLPTPMVLPTGQAATSTPHNTAVVEVAVQPSALPPTALPTAIAPTETLAPQAATAIPVQPVAFQSLQVEQATVIPAPPAKPVPNQVTIKFAPGTTLDQQKAYVQQIGGSIQQSLDALNTLVVTIPDVAAAEALPRSALVVQTEPDFYVTAQQSAPNDFYYNQQWALPVIQAPGAWPLLPTNAPTVAVAVIDSGICANHPDLVGRILPGYDFIESDTTPQDEYGHGCEVSGIIAANMNNNIGIAGVAPNARVMPLRVLDASGNGYYSNVAAAILYAADNGAQIINLSLGGTVPSTTLQSAVDYAVAHGVLVVAAAGNSYGGAVMYPAAYPNVVAVASVDNNLQISSFSAVGPEVDLLAPGRDIMSTRLDGSYMASNGTSFAAPQVAGIAALEIGRGKTLIIDGGVVHADVPVPEPTLTPTIEVIFDKYGNPIPQSVADGPEATDTWAVVLQHGTNPNTITAQLGYENLGQIGNLPDTYLFRSPMTGSSAQSALDTANALQSVSKIVSFQRQYAQQQIPRTPGDDPKYGDQWHLENTGQNGAVAGEDANVIAAWNAGYIGTGVQIAVVDDGLQYTHPDLAPNYVAAGSYDFNYGDPDPMPGNNDPHGTSAAGVAAAADNTTPANPTSDCGVGVAYDAHLAGVRLIAGASTDAMEASALSYRNGSSPGATSVNDIYSNSSGPSDTGSVLAKPGSLTLAALLNNVTYGRGGRGNVYVWAAGNGLQNADNINADGYANSRFVIAVGAVGADGKQAYYSEPGAPMLVTAPSSSATGPGITTTDLLGYPGYNATVHITGDYSDTQNCTKFFGGTSSATPLVSGIVALMLQANPDLTWRDVQYILLQTAEQNDPTDTDWTTNGANYHINDKYGFGRVDAGAAVNAATTWQHVGPEGNEATAVQVVNTTIPDDTDPGLSRTLTINTHQPVEHVEVIFNASHTYRGDLKITLTSPQGTISKLMEPRPLDGGDNYTDWKFTSVRDWGEDPSGTWTLEVSDTAIDDEGFWQNWQLIVYTQQSPPVPVPQSPGNNLLVSTYYNSTPMTLNWTTPSPFNVNGYELRLDTLNPPVNTFSLTSTSYSTNLPLGAYYWQVRAIGNTTVGDSNWSAIQSFTIGAASNASPPRNYFTTASPVLSWTYLSWATAYQVEISTTSTFAPGSQVYISPDGTGAASPIPPTDLSFMVVDAVTLPSGLSEGTYYWRVRGRKADGTWSATWSSYDSFIVDS